MKNIELNKKRAEAIKDLLTPTYLKIIEKLEKENKRSNSWTREWKSSQWELQWDKF